MFKISENSVQDPWTQDIIMTIALGEILCFFFFFSSIISRKLLLFLYIPQRSMIWICALFFLIIFNIILELKVLKPCFLLVFFLKFSKFFVHILKCLIMMYILNWKWTQVIIKIHWRTTYSLILACFYIYNVPTSIIEIVRIFTIAPAHINSQVHIILLSLL